MVTLSTARNPRMASQTQEKTLETRWIEDAKKRGEAIVSREKRLRSRMNQKNRTRKPAVNALSNDLWQ